MRDSYHGNNPKNDQKASCDQAEPLLIYGAGMHLLTCTLGVGIAICAREATAYGRVRQGTAGYGRVRQGTVGNQSASLSLMEPK